MPMREPTVVIVDDRRNPFHLYLVGACVLAGVGGLINPGRGSTLLREFFPAWQLYVWYGGLSAGGVIALVALFLSVDVGYYVERIGLLLLAGLCLSYTSAIFVSAPQVLALGGLSILAFTVACVARLIQVQRIIRARR